MSFQTPIKFSAIDVVSVGTRFKGALTLTAATVMLLAMYWSTASSAVHLWDTSSTYTYAYLIAPISLYLVWSDRHLLARMTAHSSFAGILVVGLFGASWFVADMLSINVGRHIAFIGIFQGLCLCVLGRAIYRRIAFALNYLWLMVPTGEFLLRPLQEVAHRGATALLQLSGIPVFADGLLIQVPQGSFVVEPGCAGLNFLLAALALSLLYGKILFRTLSARILCVAIALAVAVLSNILRIYLIIALTEWTDQRIGLADDHLLFGWGFFSIIMLALMWVGARGEQPEFAHKPERKVVSAHDFSDNRSITMTLIVLVVAAVGPAFVAWISIPASASASYAELPKQLGPWQQTDSGISNWTPQMAAGDTILQATYAEAAGQRVQVVIVIYNQQRTGHEATSAINSPADGRVWHLLDTKLQAATVAGRDVSIAAASLQAGSVRRDALSWYETGDCITYSRLRTKLCRAWQQLRGHSTAGAFVVLSAQRAADQTADLTAMLDIAKRLPALALIDVPPFTVVKD